jgi:hypothetical protein
MGKERQPIREGNLIAHYQPSLCKVIMVGLIKVEIQSKWWKLIQVTLLR